MSSRNQLSSKQLRIYKESFGNYGDKPRATFQNDLVTMHARYDSLLKNTLEFLPTKFSILDVGCGLGNLHEFLLDLGIDHEYTGLELVSEMASFCENKFPNAKWIVGDIANLSEAVKYDIVVASGTFNLSMQETPNVWLNYVRMSLSKMYSLANSAVSFNALSGFSEFRAKNLFYFEEKWALDFARSKTRFFNLSYLSPLYEFTLSLVKEECIRKKFCAREFDRYFHS